jgi:predicted nucleotidyltransferase
MAYSEKTVYHMKAALQHILEQFRRGLESIYGSRLAEVVLFGSQAREDAEPGSDIDVLVVLRSAVDPHQEMLRLSEFKSRLCLQYDVVISCVYVSEADFQHDETPLMLNVRREGVLV